LGRCAKVSQPPAPADGKPAARATPVLVTVTVSASSKTLLVRVAHKGKSLTY